MMQMTGRERVIAAFRAEEHDRIPLVSPVSLANMECMELARTYFPYANYHAEKMAALARTSFSILKFDSVMPYFGITNEAYALGCGVDWGTKTEFPKVISSVFASPEDFTRPQGYLDAKPLRSIVDAIRILKRSTQGNAAIFGKVIGPMSLIFSSCGVQNTLNNLVLKPEMIRQVLEESKQLCIDFARLQIEAGADIITVSEDGAGDLISRNCFRQILMKAEHDIYEAISKDAWTVFHLSCAIMDRADLFAQTGFHALSFDACNDLITLKKMVGDMRLIGCVNNPATLLNGSSKNVIDEVMSNIQNGVAMVAPECSIPLRVSNRNLMAMRDAVTLYESRKRRERRD